MHCYACRKFLSKKVCPLLLKTINLLVRRQYKEEEIHTTVERKTSVQIFKCTTATDWFTWATG
jgi:hypothetical protein